MNHDESRKAKLKALIDEATVDCYGEDEAFWCFFTVLEERLAFPLKAEIVGRRVTVVGLDGHRSSLYRGIVARVQHAGEEYTASLLDLDLVDADPESSEWLEAYRYWVEQ
jgi:hypothetical protein